MNQFFLFDTSQGNIMSILYIMSKSIKPKEEILLRKFLKKYENIKEHQVENLIEKKDAYGYKIETKGSTGPTLKHNDTIIAHLSESTMNAEEIRIQLNKLQNNQKPISCTISGGKRKSIKSKKLKKSKKSKKTRKTHRK